MPYMELFEMLKVGAYVASHFLHVVRSFPSYAKVHYSLL